MANAVATMFTDHTAFTFILVLMVRLILSICFYIWLIYLLFSDLFG